MSGMGFTMARHLLSRTGFGGRPREIVEMANRSWQTGIDTLVGGIRTTHIVTAPTWVKDHPPAPTGDRAVRRERRKLWREQGRELQAWWMTEMLQTPSPMTERLVLMWHNHFTSSLRKARWAPLMYRQNQTLRRHAAGNFRNLLGAIVRDPAMLVYLDNTRNRAGHPNENLARELLELFTLGIGNYTERDVREVARVLTGMHVDRRTGQPVFRQRRHDHGVKTVLGRRGHFTVDDLPELILQRTQAAEHIASRVYREFVGVAPDRAERRRLGQVFTDADFEILPLLKAVLNAPGFVTKTNIGTLVRSPIDLLIATHRTLQLSVSDAVALARASGRLGQAPMQPPNVKGWPGGTAWIQAATVLGRHAVVCRILRGMERAFPTWDRVHRWLGSPNLSRAELMETSRRVLVPVPLVTRVSQPRTPIDMFEHVMLDPTFQLS